jgi:hypothetical protein
MKFHTRTATLVRDLTPLKRFQVLTHKILDTGILFVSTPRVFFEMVEHNDSSNPQMEDNIVD